MAHFDAAALAVSFVDTLARVHGYSPLTVRHYTQVLEEARAAWECWQEEESVVISLMPWRMKIASQSKATVARKVSTVRSFAAWLREQGWHIKLSGATLTKKSRSLPKPLPVETIRAALEAADLQEKALVGVMFGCGLRIAELADLRVDHIGQGWIRVTGKGSKSRDIPLPEAVQMLVREYRAAFPAAHYLFEHGGARMGEARIRRALQTLFARVGVRMTPHQLRHSYATHLLAEGARISDVSELLGHAHLSTTQIYTQLGMQTKMDNYKTAHPLCRKEPHAV